MTSAARPTFDHAKGRDRKVSSSIAHKRGLTSHSKLKFRNKKQRINEEFDNEDDSEEDENQTEDGRKLEGVDVAKVALLKKELESSERTDPQISLEKPEHHNEVAEQTEDSVAQISDKRDSDLSSEEEYEDDDDDDDDEEEELLREIEQIKKEREDAKQEAERQEAEERVKNSNPLILAQDIVPSSLSKDTTESPKKKSWRSAKSMRKKSNLSEADRFSNDTINSDFHKDFLDKYVR